MGATVGSQSSSMLLPSILALTLAPASSIYFCISLTLAPKSAKLIPLPPELLLLNDADFCLSALATVDSDCTAPVLFMSATTVKSGYITVRLISVFVGDWLLKLLFCNLYLIHHSKS